jgi:hypothetical protein
MHRAAPFSYYPFRSSNSVLNTASMRATIQCIVAFHPRSLRGGTISAMGVKMKSHLFFVVAVTAAALWTTGAHSQPPPWGPMAAPANPLRPADSTGQPVPKANPKFRTITENWSFVDVTGAGAAVNVYESCDECNGHIHSPGGANKTEFSGTDDSTGDTKVASQSFEKGSDGMYKRVHTVWHVKNKHEGDRKGKWYGGGTATRVDIKHTWEEEVSGTKWTKVANTDVWEKRTWPPKVIGVAIVVWDAPREDPCSDTVYFGE